MLVGYKMGTDFIQMASEKGIMQHAVRAASIVGLTMIGGMIPMMVSVPINITFRMNGIETSLVDLFNGIIPGFLELAAVLLFMRLFKKNINPIIMVLCTMALGILGAWIGVF